MAGTHLRFIDAAPRSPTRRVASDRFRLSPGDQLIARVPVLDRDGGARAGTVCVHETVLIGGRLSTATSAGNGAIKLRDGQIISEGLGVHGQSTSEIGDHGVTITLHLLS